MQPTDSVDRLAEAVADGTDVDWNESESSAQTEDERRILRQLKFLASLGAAARRQLTTWGPLEIRGEVGSGSFGTVHHAWDTRLERQVALKLLHADANTPEQAFAIIKEGRVLARIRHPNVVTVHGADVSDGRVGIWMEFVTGRTLRTIVTEQGPFGSHETALIGRDLCRALAAVHQCGYLHRDVKAQNVMREAGGRTVLMDFGAGEAIVREGGDALRGTPVYLAPELLNGEPPTVRSDIYSLGILLYFLVSGSFPVSGNSLEDIRALHAEGRRVPLRDARPDVDPGLLRAIEAATAADPDDRPESAGAFESLLDAALRDESHTTTTRRRWRALALAAAALVLVAVPIGWLLRDRTYGAAMHRDSVAVLPITSLTPSQDDAYFAEGMTSDLIANLAVLPDLRVIAGSSMRKYADRKKSAVEIGSELGVATVLDANVRRSGDHVRIVAQLIDAKTGEQIWSAPFDRKVDEIVAMKSDVTNRIAIALKGELSTRDTELLRPGRPYDYEAFDLYTKGRHQWELRTEESINRSIQYYTEALGRDPKFALAYAGLADAYTILGVYGSIPREEAYRRAADAAAKAVELDDSLAEAHASLGLARKNRFEWAAAEQSFKRAIELKPGSALAHQWYSVLLTQTGDFSKAMAESKLAISLDPLSIAPRLQNASLLMMAGRYEESIKQYDQAIVMDSEFATAYRHRAQAYTLTGDYARAEESLDTARAKSPLGADDLEVKADRGYLYAVSGRTNEARAIVGELTRRYDVAHEAVSGSIALVYAGLGERDQAFVWLRRACENRDPEAGYLLVAPRWVRLRSDPRYWELVRALGFKVPEGAADGRQQR
jgi:serine/threonine protein kinase/tetratricopeptide (TPR) repeat protein